MSHLIKIYHSYEEGKKAFASFLDDISKTLSKQTYSLGLHYAKGEIFYSLNTTPKTYAAFESQFYTHFNNFQIAPDDKNIRSYDKTKTVIGELKLANGRFFPFKTDNEDNSEFVFNMFRTFENFDVINDKVGFFVELKSIINESFFFYLKSKFDHWLFRWKLGFQFYKYIFSHKTQKNWKAEGHKFFHDKIQNNLFETKLYFVVQSQTKQLAEARVKTLFNNFLVFKNYPLNQFQVKVHRNVDSLTAIKNFRGKFQRNFFTPEEIASFFHFPQNPKNETSLLTVKSRKLAIPVGIPTFEYTVNEKNEVIAKGFPREVNIVGVSDYRSITVPIGIYDEDRLRHVYAIGKT
jgi:hypothetical protein